MSAHFKWYPGSEEVVVPWNARYSFPSQANKAVKITPRIPPKNGSNFLPGNVIRLEFPAQGYVNPANTTMEFDVTLGGYGTSTSEVVRFQNNIQSIFSRVRLLYGSTPLEDIINYNVIVRALTEWTASDQNNTIDQTSIAEGIGGFVAAKNVNVSAVAYSTGAVNVRQAFIQGSDQTTTTGNLGAGSVPAGTNTGIPLSTASSKTTTRRYQIQFALGLFTQAKLIPTKFMASQLAIELTLANEPGAIFVQVAGSGVTPTYAVGNVNLIPEILEFDSSYDEMFLKGLREGGVPIKFSSWHTYIFSNGASSNANLLIQERSRSVKAIFTVQRSAPANLLYDAGAMHFDTSQITASSPGASTLTNYQYRIGGRYFPASPVQCGVTSSNGACEAYLELQKALNMVGDYRVSAPVSALRWGVTSISPSGTRPSYQESDYAYSAVSLGPGQGSTNAYGLYAAPTGGNAYAGNLGSQCFAMAVSLESSNGVEISGLNAEEQSDISLIVNFTGTQAAGFVYETYVYYDAMIVLRENNVLELIQ